MPKRFTVADIMTSKPVTVYPETKLSLVYETMTEEMIRHMPVINRRGELEGIISHRDLVRSVLFAVEDLPFSEHRNALDKISAGQVMTIDPETVKPEAALVEAGRLLIDNKYGCVPVVSGKQLVGIVTETDFVLLALREVR